MTDWVDGFESLAVTCGRVAVFGDARRPERQGHTRCRVIIGDRRGDLLSAILGAAGDARQSITTDSLPSNVASFSQSA